MGRTSKFTFPIPGRKPKPTLDLTASPPTSKAQQFLGSCEINVDSPRPWDSASQSGMSISIAESMTSQASSGTATGFRDKGRVIHGLPQADFDEESDIVPSNLRNFERQGKDYRDLSTDASSIQQRRRSTSTIMSWYDKTKLPLSISQQTSSSAMAKGLPSKANTLLDVGGLVSQPRAQRKPSRLDFSNLLPGYRQNRSQTSVAASEYSPSVDSPMATVSPSPTKQRSFRSLNTKATKDRINQLMQSASTKSNPPSHNAAVLSGPAGLDQLYEHYEQMSFLQVEESDFDATRQNVAKTAVNKVAANQLPHPIIREPESSAQQESHSSTNNPKIHLSSSFMSQQAESSAGYAASISSRHTRTSKASRRTNNSLLEADLMQNSVLSLSSDSEDDGFFIDQPSKASSKRRSSSSEEASPNVEARHDRVSSSRKTHHSPVRPVAQHASPADKTYLSIPGPYAQMGVKPPTPNPRTSSLASSTAQTGGNSARSASGSSAHSGSATGWQDRPGFGIHEARTPAVLPRTIYQPPPEVHAPQPRSPYHQSPPRVLSATPSSLTGGQLTPPLSPASLESYAASPSTASEDIIDPSQSRLMAVTKQEEMLLAALRSKRAKMRENIFSECERELQSRNMLPTRTHARTRSKDLPNGYSPTRISVIPEHPHPDNHTASRPRLMTRDSEISVADSRHEHVPLYLDARPLSAADANHVDDLDLDGGEPSPDLNDFMDFDDGTSDDDDAVSGMRPAAIPSGGKTGESEGNTSAFHSRSTSMDSTASSGAVVQVVDEEDSSCVDVPRPDSPVSPIMPVSLGPPPKKSLRLSAVGRIGMEVGWWGDDG